MSQPIDPFYGRPSARLREVRDAVIADIQCRPTWEAQFAQGKMVGILLASDANGREHILRAYSGIVHINNIYNVCADGNTEPYFVPPVYDLDVADDFYRLEEQRISAINHEIETTDDESVIVRLRNERRTRSIALQRAIFEHFVFVDRSGNRRDLIELFEQSRHRMPPGGAGECAAPRLLHAAIGRKLTPLEMGEFWYGASPTGESRVHGCWYPSCMEKCSPILAFQLSGQRRKPASDIRDVGKDRIRVVYEDDDIVVVDKPAGMLSVPGKDISQTSVEQWLLARYSDCHGPMLAHRLDMATSGLLVAAKNARSHKILQAHFSSHEVEKQYVAWLRGVLPSSCGVISLPLCANPEDRPRQVVDFHYGKIAISRYQVVERREEEIDGRREVITVVTLRPLTGRTHQLRVHAADVRGLGTPMVGDALYDTPPSAGRLMLHSASISFSHPATRRIVRVTSHSPAFN